MALITEKAIVLLLVISFVQIVHLQARHTEHVFGPRQHLDSGQDFRETQLRDFEPQRNIAFRNSYNLPREFLNDHEGVVQTIPKILEENEENQIFGDENEGLDFEDYDDNEDEYYDYYGESDEIEEDYYDYEVPLKRVRRRIIPIGGGPLDRRNDRNGGYGRIRGRWDQPLRNRDPVVRRSGPTGSAALFSLFPDLAPPDWKTNRGINGKKKKKGNHNKKDDLESDRTSIPKDEKMEEKSQRDDPSSDSSSHHKKKTSKKKTRLSKKEKEEIAKFAESHGVERAVSHFKSRVSAPLRVNAVEKFLRRYKNRLQRKASRS